MAEEGEDEGNYNRQRTKTNYPTGVLISP